MREILFRGKRKSNGKWIEGYVFKQFVSIKDEYYIRYGDTDYLVIPETVGQYTGLTDKNRNKIFEGDIVELHFSGARGVVIFDKYCFIIEVHAFGGMERNIIGEYDKDVLEVIGNVHDNPELLKGE
ncbi:MAG: YopX family protein [Oscillospiraceae bacterium]